MFNNDQLVISTVSAVLLVWSIRAVLDPITAVNIPNVKARECTFRQHCSVITKGWAEMKQNYNSFSWTSKLWYLIQANESMWYLFFNSMFHRREFHISKQPFTNPFRTLPMVSRIRPECFENMLVFLKKISEALQSCRGLPRKIRRYRCMLWATLLRVILGRLLLHLLPTFAGT